MNYHRDYEHSPVVSEFQAEFFGGPRDGEFITVQEKIVGGWPNLSPSIILSGHGFYMLDSVNKRFLFNGGSKQ